MTAEEAQRRAREVVESFENVSILELQDRIAAAILDACEAERMVLLAAKDAGPSVVDVVSQSRVRVVANFPKRPPDRS
ncbi:MAG TPA: hypothetical protein VKU01_26060 [Bryobacteraceae bacterium]|nr:hypothetical protein [Bryobacteraceae bacterium]